MTPEETLEIMRKNYPDAKYYLSFSNPLELLVAAILSAQCRDEVVNATTRRLFTKYKTAEDYTRLQDSELSAITFFRAKGKNIREAAKIISEKYNGKVPKTAKELTELPGIGKKTANAIMQNAFGIVEGVVVDTHVVRVAYRLGWTKNKNPEKIEEDLMNIFTRKYWKMLPHVLKAHGRATCRAPMPLCSKCPVKELCHKNGVTKRL